MDPTEPMGRTDGRDAVTEDRPLSPGDREPLRARPPLDLPAERRVSVTLEELQALDEVAPWEEYLFTPTGERIPKEVTDEDV
ncbi:hypothetical protein [Alicyclobacillus macrosporangiidus]|uniref:Uncharacterized protein n=1 Tax=Alicyclobacillus macrosporangiidus TaxID=392015 RepID=A0A1I7F9T9_9BACL|nr:hypothetical protein [Alicyclobacillus macrosporangiidus]SFU32909.1 hypothetical protein SAMN05421543_101134 [Alicyclobacillus macrosporangiidus]